MLRIWTLLIPAGQDTITTQYVKTFEIEAAKEGVDIVNIALGSLI